LEREDSWILEARRLTLRGDAISGAWVHFEARVFDWLLPAIASAFVFACIQRQMKNFFVRGLIFFAIAYTACNRTSSRGAPHGPLSCWRPEWR